MKRRTVIRSAGVMAAAALLVVPGATFGSFSDRAITPGNVIGATTLEVRTSGGTGTGTDHLNFDFDNMLPGVPQMASGTYANTGGMAQDVWLLFNDGALDDIGPDGEVHVTSNGREIFASPSPLPRVLKLAGNVNPGAVGSFSFSLNYGTPFSLNPTAPTTWSLQYQLVATQPGIAP